MILDLFRGPGGWSTGLRMLGINTAVDEVGVELDEHAAATARKAGHRTLVADVSTLDYTGRSFDGVIASPPCQGFSMAGKGKGRADSLLLVDSIVELANMTALGFVDPLADLVDRIEGLHADMTDDRSLLALEPLRAVLAVRPEWTCWEQVPAVLPLWQACADVLRALGYDVEARLVYAEQYGVPQTRKRAILRAVRGRELAPLIATHSRYYSRNPGKLDPGVQKWVSMAEALGWDGPAVMRSNYGTGGDASNRGERTLDQPAPTVTSKVGRNKWTMRTSYGTPMVGNRNGTHELDPFNRPAHTVTSKTKDWQVVPGDGTYRRTAGGYRRIDRDAPAPTIKPVNPSGASSAPRFDDLVHLPSADEFVTTADARELVGAPVHSVRVTVAEAAVLQSFPPEYPWQGTRTAQYRQVGDAVPPLLAAHVVASVLPAAAGAQNTQETAA